MYLLSTESTFDSAHRLLGYEGKCQFVHGHRWLVEVVASCNYVQPIGFVIDFGILDNIVKGWIDGNLDHSTILSSSDPLCDLLLDTGNKVFKLNSNPTAEYLAFYLYSVLTNLIKEVNKDIEVDSVTVWETPKHSATYKRNN
jgi:6-pyruvoyltetrahydropterin/6-carboxytetrahydropterin synthase